jgi:hypothetical protein
MFRLNWEENRFANTSTLLTSQLYVEAVAISRLNCELADFITQPTVALPTNRRIGGFLLLGD